MSALRRCLEKGIINRICSKCGGKGGNEAQKECDKRNEGIKGLLITQ